MVALCGAVCSMHGVIVSSQQGTAFSVKKDTLINEDSAIVITTICSPICSSVARVYAIDKESEQPWVLVRTIKSPDPKMTFPEAYFEHRELKWRDNSSQLLDEEGK